MTTYEKGKLYDLPIIDLKADPKSLHKYRGNTKLLPSRALPRLVIAAGGTDLMVKSLWTILREVGTMNRDVFGVCNQGIYRMTERRQ